MSPSSEKSTAPRRAPQRRRGHERVATLLEAAATCFATKGYDGTTMTQVATHAGASIGSLYQFFATKEVLAQALVDSHAQALQAEVSTLDERSRGWNNAELAAALCDMLIAYRRSRPTFALLAGAVGSLPPELTRSIRQGLRLRLAELLLQRIPQLDKKSASAAAVVVLQWTKSAATLAGEPELRGREAALAQVRLALRLYLDALSGIEQT